MRWALALLLVGCSAVGPKGPIVDYMTVEDAVQALRRELPIKEGVSVVHEELEDEWEETEFDEHLGLFVLRIDPRTPPQMAGEMVIHEWAHMLVWHLPFQEDHGAMWGIAYSECYRVAHGCK